MFEEYLIAFLTAMGGIVLGSVINYVILRRLFRTQSKGILDVFLESETAKELVKLLRKANEFIESEEAKEILEAIRKMLNIAENKKKREPLITLPERPESD